MTDYAEFLRAKKPIANSYGFDVDKTLTNPILKPHQAAIVKWAIAGGRRAIFAAFGLGKSFMQLEICRLINQREGGRALIVCPLGVRVEFAADAEKLGDYRAGLGTGHLELRFVRRTEELDGDGIYITNYESVRDGRLDVTSFTVVSLDEASVLRSYGSKTYQEFLTMFDHVPYRFVATATPAPNRHKELIHYAGYLGVMDTGAALTRFFQRDSTKAGNLTLYPHKEREFWLWLNTWAIFLQSPADLGYDATGYDLPPLDVQWHEVLFNPGDTPVDRDGLPATFMSLAPGSWHPEVWHDVNRMRTLNGEQSHRAQVMHVCPLQFDIVERLIRRFSNEGELVYDPFGGLMTVPMMALRMGRRGRGVELNPGYFADGVKYLEAEERQQHMPTLFDLEPDLGATA